MTEGVTATRFKAGVWFVGEDRDTAFDGSSEVDNPLRERTRILLPLATFDVRLTDRIGVQVAATIFLRAGPGTRDSGSGIRDPASGGRRSAVGSRFEVRGSLPSAFCRGRNNLRQFTRAGVAELADARDLKSRGRKAVWVRFPPPAR